MPAKIEVVHHPGGAGALPLFDDGTVMLVKQYRYPIRRLSLEIPAGRIEQGQSPLETAARELEEETGLKASQWTELLSLHLSNSVTDEKAVIYLAEILSFGVQSLEDSEDIEVLKIPLSEAISMALDGRITDAISVAALLKLATMKRFASLI